MRPRSALVWIVLLNACATAPRPPAPAGPDALLDRAIIASGGADALARASVLAWHGVAAVHVPDRDVLLEGDWTVEPPDRATVETWETARGRASARRLVVAGDSGWTVRDGREDPMTPEMVDHERGQFYLYSVLRLVPLRDPDVRLTALPPDSAGHPAVRAERTGWPTVDVYLGPDGRPVRLRNAVGDPDGGRPVLQDMALSGTIESGGVRWPREIRLSWDGRPFSDVRLTRFEARGRR